MADNTIYYKISVTGIESETDKIGQLSATIKTLDTSFKTLAKSTGDNTAAMGANRAQVALAIAEKNKLLSTTKLLLAEMQGEEGSLVRMRGDLSKATAEYDRMGAAKRNSSVGKELQKSIAEQSTALSTLEQQTGRFQRQVGNYKSGFNGLSNSINQVAREMPNFAQSATIGFMALSNNLPILADEIQRVRVANAALAADGKATTSVFKQIASSIFSWQSALITVISFSIIYAKEIGAMISGTKVLTEEEKKLIKEQEELDKQVFESTNTWKVFRGEITETEAILSNFAYTNQKALKKINEDTKKEIKEINSNWSAFKRLFSLSSGGEEGAGSYAGQVIDEIATANEKKQDKLRKLNEDNAKRFSIEAGDNIKKLNKQLADLQIAAISDEFKRELAKSKNKRDLSLQDAAYINSTGKDRQDQLNVINGIYNTEVKIATDKHNKEIEKTNKDAADKALKAKEEHDKLMIELQRKYEDSKLLLIKNEVERNQQIELERYDREVTDLIEQRRLVGETDLKLRNQYDLLIEQKALEHQKKLDEIALPQLEGKTQSVGGKIDLVKPKGTYGKDRTKEFKDAEDQLKQAINAEITAAKQTADAISQIKQQAIDRDLKRQLTAIQRNADKEDRILENRLKNGIISEGQYNDAKQKLNNETAAKELAANRKAFEEKKKLDTATAIANGALAITSILAHLGGVAFGIPAAIEVAAAVVETATQVAVIQSQKFALGGKVDGKSHAQGGVMIEAEGGEGIINANSMRSNRVMSMVGTPSQIASSINASGGGVSWESNLSNRPNPNMFKNNSVNSSITFGQMSGLIQELKNGINDKKVVILESDITKTQNKVKAYETSGRF